MAKPGPKPKPTNLRVLEGDHHKSRYNLNEPQFAAFDVDDIPERVRANEDALALWMRLAPKLTAAGILRDTHHTAMEALCVHYGMWALRPSMAMTSKLFTFLAEFGVTPSSQTRLVGKLPHEDPADPVAKKLASL